MSFHDELRRLKTAEEQTRRAEESRARQAAQDAAELQAKLRAAMAAAVARATEQWNPVVSSLLVEVARAHWGQNKYWLLGPGPVSSTDSVDSIPWIVARAVSAHRAETFKVELILAKASLEDPVRVDPRALITAVTLRARGAQELTSPATAQSLRDALKTVFLSGPAEGDLPEWAQRRLDSLPYREGERDDSGGDVMGIAGAGAVIGSILSFYLGLLILVDGSLADIGYMLMHPFSRYVVMAAVLLPLGAMFTWWATSKGARFRRLSFPRKAVAVAGASPAFVIVMALLSTAFAAIVATALVLALAAIGLWAAMRGTEEPEERRVREIEEGVRRALGGGHE